jgi:hypothetical protein
MGLNQTELSLICRPEEASPSRLVVVDQLPVPSTHNYFDPMTMLSVDMFPESNHSPAISEAFIPNIDSAMSISSSTLRYRVFLTNTNFFDS